MIKVTRLQHRFVAGVPHEMDPGILYISLEYASMIHLCACGCGREVVTPLSPKDWKMTFDGETVSVVPSIGSWSLPCRSHYFIHQNHIQWASNWTDEQIQRGRELDLQRKRGGNKTESATKLRPDTAPLKKSEKFGLLKKVLHWLTG